MYDHYCPYIGNAIGGGNYIYFVAFIFIGMLGVLGTFMAVLQYLLYVSMKSALVWFLAFDFFGVSLMALLMNQYHLSLILRNLTTNEDINKDRYAYLRDDLGHYHNPFSQGPCGNVRECLGRRAVVLGDPYIHSKIYNGICHPVGRPGDERDIEMAEAEGGGGENERLAPSNP